jgi:hypothetical protein
VKWARRCTVALVLLAGPLGAGCRDAPQTKASASPAASPAATASGPAHHVDQTFPAAGIAKVVFRAELARAARVEHGGDAIAAAGTPKGGAPGYHPSDPNWRETPAEEWGLGFKGQAFGSTLVISTWNETRYIHHHYYLDELVLTVPQGVDVVLEERTLSGEGAPDLRAP